MEGINFIWQMYAGDELYSNDLPEVLRNAFKSGKVFSAEGESMPLDSNVSLEEAEILYSIVRRLKPSASVEVGFAKGISTLAILQALADNAHGIHHVIDPFQSQYSNAGLEMVRRAGLESCFQFHETFAENIIPNLPKVQFAFIDASHLFDLTLLEFVLIDKKLASGGVIGLHDLWMPSLRKVLSYILLNRDYQIYTQINDSVDSKMPDLKEYFKKNFSRFLSHLPKADRIFSPDLLAYLPPLQNLTIIEKLHEDSRDWRHHANF